MMRNLKTLGLALMAVFAFAALTASAASAQGKLTSDGPVTLHGKETGAVGANSLTSFGNSTTCPPTTYTGHNVLTPQQTVEGAKHGYISVPATALTITPHYSGCTTSSPLGPLPTTVDMTGCDYDFHIGARVGPNTYKVKATVICPEGANIKVTVFLDAGHTQLACTSTITQNPAGYDGLHLVNTPNKKVSVIGTIEGIEAHRSGEFCAPETKKDGILHIDAVFEGRDVNGNTTPISISG